MNTKHTPGPWSGKDGQIYSDQTGKTLALITYFDKDEENDKANQQLIAAAPELLETLQYIVQEIETTPEQLSEALLGLIKIKANKAIKKATNQ